jgi:hypothetical protein
MGPLLCLDSTTTEARQIGFEVVARLQICSVGSRVNESSGGLIKFLLKAWFEYG